MHVHLLSKYNFIVNFCYIVYLKIKISDICFFLYINNFILYTYWCIINIFHWNILILCYINIKNKSCFRIFLIKI